MLITHNERFQALRRIQRFLDQHDAALDTLNTSNARAELDETVCALEALASEQRAAHADRAAWGLRKRDRRDELKWLHMERIAAIAHSELGHIAELFDLRLPVGNPPDATLIAAAVAMARAAAVHADVFTQHELPADFLRQLRAAAAAVEQAVAAQATCQDRQRAARDGFSCRLSESRPLVGVLNALVQRRIRHDPGLLAAWRLAKQVRPTPFSALSPV